MIQFSQPTNAVPLHLGDDSDNWSRIRTMARAIPDDVDLDDASDVIRSLYAARYCRADFFADLDDIIAEARNMRNEAR